MQDKKCQVSDIAPKISEVINKLEDIAEHYGDVGVYLYNPDSDEASSEFPIESIKPAFIDGKIQALIL